MRFTKLLASDLDGTLVPNGHRFDEKSVDRFATARKNNPKTALAYVTGRHLALAQKGVRTWGLPKPDFFITDVGTQIWRKKGKTWRLDPHWKKRLASTWHDLPRSKLVFLLKACHDACKGMVPQEPSKQSPFKQSYYTDPSDPHIAAHVKHVLHAAGIHATVVFSVDEKQKRGLLDVLPKNAEKDAALDFLRKSMGLRKTDVLYAGDSGNDLSALTHGFHAVVVANAPPSFKREVLRVAEHKKSGARILIASKNYADGVLQGARRFGVMV